MIIDYNIISTWAALAAALTATIAILVEGQRSRYSQGIDLLFRLFDTFDSELIKSKRKKACKLLLKQYRGKLSSRDRQILENSLSDILDHFQIVGIMSQKGRLDIDLVHSGYSYWVEYYWFLVESQLSTLRVSDDETIMRPQYNFITLVNTCLM